MKSNKLTIAGLAAAALAVSGCSDFLTGAGIDDNPNQPSAATTEQLFVAAQAQGFVRQEGQVARSAAMFIQQLSGTNNQQKDYGSSYLNTEAAYSTMFSGFYTGGGLVDWRKVQANSRAAGDQQFEGIAKVWEALMMGTAAAVWGDIPYREAVAETTAPALDPQQQVYADMQALLSEAITLLGGTGPGPGNTDLVFGGNVGRWTRVAHTLKARYHMHTAERLGTPAYQAALAAAQNGINEAPASVAVATNQQSPGNLRSFHGTTEQEGNLWGQFIVARSDLAAGQALATILNRRTGDPRKAGYFTLINDSIIAANRFGAASTTPSIVATARRPYDFRQPIVTWEENQLIMAEAKLALGDPTAINHVNAVRASVGLPALAGPATLAMIMEEKYIALFQNIEVWNDYKRTCFPALLPAGAPVAKEIPGRLPYGQSERQNNPNIPAVNSQPLRNWNDPNPCTS
ncbi:MAG TPA: SusD/RagB family nutrient-binding outer membrane lipoprotein [Longimicrobium sp.]|uniref:SusD/RagB family nutrient-binding outer membrane lipoprotein n=1 Tax=Longimicrobium sp. TaxID=2029185 RepID=UPI002ED877E9